MPLAAVSTPAGAEALRDRLVPALCDLHTTVQETAVSLERVSGNPIRDAFDVAAGLAHRVREAREEGRFVIVLAGACLSALGSCAGLRSTERGIVWLDAHADFNTPETTCSGLLDGMALATLTGRCWSGLTARIPGFRPVPEESVDLVGARDLDDAEAALLEGSSIRRWAADALAGLAEARYLQETEATYVHLDLDVLDPSVGRANRLAFPGGLSGDALEALFTSLGRHAPVGVLALTAYDPAEDETGQAAAAAVRAARALVAARLERSG